MAEKKTPEKKPAPKKPAPKKPTKKVAPKKATTVKAEPAPKKEPHRIQIELSIPSFGAITNPVDVVIKAAGNVIQKFTHIPETIKKK